MKDKPSMLESFAAFVVRHRLIFIGIFFALLVACVVLIFFVNVTYDLSGYVPAGSDTAESAAVLSDEFDDRGTANILIKNITYGDAIAYAEKIELLDGVAACTFTGSDFKESNVIYTVSLKDYDSTDGANAAVGRLLNFIKNDIGGREAYISGQSASTYFTRQTTEESIMAVMIVIVVVILLMLLLTSKTYFEVLLMLVVFGVAVGINMGTNFFFPEISYVSNLISLVLQLALSIDYSVILLHRFTEERKFSDSKTAAKNALKKAVPEILSSSLTTVAGLAALMFMALPIGFELGLSLTKGILISLATVVFLMPALLVFSAKPITATEHKVFVPRVTKPIRATLRARYIIAPIFLVITVLAGYASFSNTYTFAMNNTPAFSEANAKTQEVFGFRNPLIVIVPKGDYEKEKALAEFMLKKDIINSAVGLASLDVEIAPGIRLTDKLTVAEVESLLAGMDLSLEISRGQLEFLFSMYKSANDPESNVDIKDYAIPVAGLFAFIGGTLSDADIEGMEQFSELAAVVSNFEGENYSRIIFNINADYEALETFALIEELKKELPQFYDEFYLAGESVAFYDMSLTFPLDNLKVMLFTLAFILIILLATFRNGALPILLIVAIQAGIWINFALPFLTGSALSFIGYLLISAIQMGATIDYAIVLSSRYRGLKIDFGGNVEAMAEATNAVFPTIITSGTILTVTGFSLGMLSTGLVADMGILLGIGTLASMVIVIFVLPSILVIFDKLVEKLQFKLKKRAKP